jgi:ABC-type sugar transport system, permease component
MKTYKQNYFGLTLIHLFFIVFSILCILPFIAVVSISLSNEKDIVNFGYSILPRRIDLTAYQYIIANPRQILDGYKISILVTVVGTFISTLLTAMAAYPLSRRSFKYKRFISLYFYFTMLFSGGLVPTYILITKYLKMTDTIWVLIIPGLINAYFIILLRTFFQKTPESIIESAKIDGASELLIFFRLIVPISTPGLATVAFLGAVNRWNDWFTPMLFIDTKQNLIPLQYLLQRIMVFIQFLQMDNAPRSLLNTVKVPSESARMAMCVLAAGPMLFIFPFFQKYFAEGLTVGSLKG